MKNILALVVAAFVFCVNAQNSGSSVEQEFEAQQARIQIERRKVQSVHEVYESQCYQRFAVNDCLRVARNERRDLLADLRRQELSLNSAEAKRKGANTIRRLDKNRP